jgi:hypothetical protein
MNRIVQNERGMALAVAIFTLVVVGALVAGALFVGTQEQRVGLNSSRTEQSFRMAELGVAEVIGGWSANRLTYNRMRAFPTDTTKLAWTKTVNGTGSYSGNVFKLNSTQFLLDITASDTMSRAGRVREGGARQRIGIIARILPLQVDMQAALTVGGPVVFGGGNVFVKGQDTPPPPANGWSACPTASPTIAGVRAKNAGDVANSSGQVSGSPNVLITPAMDSTTFTQFGATSYAQLAATANVILGAGTYAPTPATVGATCNTAVMTNWGDGNNRAAACGDYFPIIHITGNATLSGGQGQGILMADGNLVLSGSFTFYGLVIAKGGFSTVPGGSSKIYGSVMAQSINLATTAFNGDVVINYSNCALSQALQYTGVAALNRSRSWIQLF